MPYAIAMKKGFFQQEGADITGILSSNGGGTTVRNLMEGNLPYGEVDLAGTVLAIQQGAPLKIISDNVLTVAEFVWAVRPDSPIKTLKDFRGQKIGYTNPRSTSQALDVLLLQTAGMTPKDAELVRVGGFGEQIVALEPRLHHCRYAGRSGVVAEHQQAAPHRPSGRRVAATVQRRRRHDRKSRRRPGRFLRAILRGRRKAVEFMYAHPDEAAAIVAEVYRLDPDGGAACNRGPGRQERV